MENELVALSQELADAVERAGRAVVAVNARPRISSSGVHWRRGAIVTAHHTIRRDDDIRVVLPGGRDVPATLAGRDPATDLAVLRVDDAELPPEAEFAEAQWRPGQLVLAVGRSRETGVNATMGVVNAVHGPWRTWRGGLIDQFVRLDLTLYPGASGGAVVSPRGEVLGLATSGLTRLAGLCIPASTVDRTLKDLLDKGHVSRGYLGVGLQPVSIPAHLIDKLNLKERTGLITLSVEPDGPAERGGLLLGDVLVGLDGKPVRDTDDVQAALEPDSVGKPIQVSVLRAGAVKGLSITVGERRRRT